MSDKPDNDDAEGAPGPFDPSRLRLSQSFSHGSDVRRALVTVPVRKPSAQDFFRVHPDENWRLDTALIEIKADREIYLVDPAIWPLFPNECKPRTLYTTIDRRNVLTLWPVRLPDENGRLDDWNRSAHEAAQIAMEKWVRMSADMALGAYRIDVAVGAFPDPVWPTDVTFADLLKIAFKGKMIEDLDHPVLRRLRGEI
ncbi:MAG: hypothetical protein AB7L90_07245 [Hyphomicrobiaceae bacterium]|uniref:hypothetical protein n=1 Tax=Pseudorhodoplanes sp. TaxID=1934341 RepID=UPI003D09AC8D